MTRIGRIFFVSAGAIVAAVLFILPTNSAQAQTASCTSLTVGQTQNITAFSVCKKVTLNSVPAPSAGVAGICVPTGISAAVWQSFYDNPPPGVTIASCASCTGYSYGGYCYYHGDPNSKQTCNTICAGYGGCNLAGTRYIGSDDPGSTRCAAVLSGIHGTSITAGNMTSADYGCAAITYKGGWIALNYTNPATTCASIYAPDGEGNGRVCACN